MKQELEQAAEESALKKYPSFTAENYDLVMAIRKAYANGFKAGAEWMQQQLCEKDYIKGFNAAVEKMEVALKQMKKESKQIWK